MSFVFLLVDNNGRFCERWCFMRKKTVEEGGGLKGRLIAVANERGDVIGL